MSAILAARSLNFEVSGRALLSEVTMAVTSGEMVALLGPNGAGKSTLLKLFCGQIKPTRGAVLFDGVPVASWRPRDLARRRAVLPQSSSIPFAFTALEIVLMGRSPHGDAARCEPLARAAMARMECEHLAGRTVTTLSGGEMQRVQLARVLVQIDMERQSRPVCLMLDEPISSLDPAHQHAALDAARQLARNGAAVLVVLHDLNLAAQYADRLVLLRNGRLLKEGPPRAVLTEAAIAEVFGIRVALLPNPFCDAPAVFVEPAGGQRA